MLRLRTPAWRRVLLAALLVAGAFDVLIAPGATAGGTLTPLTARIPPYLTIAGPAFSGSAIAWATPGPRGRFDLTVDRGGSLASQHVDTSASANKLVATEFAASATHAALAVNVQTCSGSYAWCKYMNYSLDESEVFAGALGQPLALRDCGGNNEGVGVESLDLSGSVLAYRDGCAHGVVVRDFAAAPETPYKVFPANHLVRLAGPYLAVDSYDSSRGAVRVTVYDWRSGQVVYGVEGSAPFDIQDDGTVVLETGTALHSTLAWASPSQPSAHPFAHVPPIDVRIAHGKVAVRTATAAKAADGFVVFDLAGRQLALAPAADAVASFDLANDRLVYATQPCEVTGIATWDLGSPPPTFAPGSCPAARASSAVADLRHRQLQVPVRCPSTPPLGCLGSWSAVLYRPRSNILRGRADALGPGEVTTLRLRLSRSQACAFARRRVRRTTIRLGSSNTRRPDVHSHPVRLRVRTVGRARGCR